jgi:hypothetical protein
MMIMLHSISPNLICTISASFLPRTCGNLGSQFERFI